MIENILGEEKLKSLLRIALDRSAADQTEAKIASGSWALTRFANSAIHQNMSSSDSVLRVRAVFGKKVAGGATNRIDEEGVKALVDNVVNMARHQDENPDFVSLPGADESEKQNEYSFSSITSESTPEQRAEKVGELIAESDKLNASAAGSLLTRACENAVMNSLGVESYYKGTMAEISTVVTGANGGFGYSSGISSDISDIDFSAIGKEASELARDSRNPIDLKPGEYECILMPHAVAGALGMFVWMGFTALSYQENRSFICGKLGEKIVSDSISIWGDPLDPNTLKTPYDEEGIAKQRVDLVKGGVASALLYDSYTAHKEGKKSNGYATGGGMFAGNNLNLVMANGDASVEDMIANTKYGVLVTRFHYTNVAHQMSASITGMTRDGTFLIENGKITCPVKNLRFTQSLIEALSCTEMVGSDRRLVRSSYVPAIKVNKFRFSSATEF